MKTVLIDLENTISNSSSRLFLLKSGDDKTFQERFVEDTLNMDIKLFIDALYKKGGYNIIILTAKTDDYYNDVSDWLEKYEVRYNMLAMKPVKNAKQNATDFKESFIRNYEDEIAFALDDVGENCALFAKYNIPCLRITQR